MCDAALSHSVVKLHVPHEQQPLTNSSSSNNNNYRIKNSELSRVADNIKAGCRKTVI